MWFYVFAVLAGLAFFGFFYSAQKREGTRMAYSGVMVCIWAALAAWFGGYLG